jgi:hypothetical protein
MYRAIRKGTSSEATESDDMHWHRQALTLNDGLRKQGKTPEGINVSWNSTIQPGLGNRTPMQAWSARDYYAVLALVPQGGMPRLRKTSYLRRRRSALATAAIAAATTIQNTTPIHACQPWGR